MSQLDEPPADDDLRSNAEDRSADVLQLADEFLERYRRGERPSIADYVQRYPTLADQIRRVFPVVAMIEEVALDRPEDDSPAPPPPEVDTAPAYIGDFRIIRQVGRGGMGIVYEAEQTSLRRRVALKVLSQNLLLRPTHRKRFQREAQAAARLHHTNIVPVFGVGEENGLHYYVMQFINGQGLDEVLAEVKRMRQQGGSAGSDVEAADENAAGSSVTASIGNLATSLLSGQFRVADGESSPASAPPREAASGAEGSQQPSQRHGHGAGTSSSGVSHPVMLPTSSGSGVSTSSRWSYWQSVAHVGMQVADAL